MNKQTFHDILAELDDNSCTFEQMKPLVIEERDAIEVILNHDSQVLPDLLIKFDIVEEILRKYLT